MGSVKRAADRRISPGWALRTQAMPPSRQQEQVDGGWLGPKGPRGPEAGQVAALDGRTGVAGLVSPSSEADLLQRPPWPASSPSANRRSAFALPSFFINPYVCVLRGNGVHRAPCCQRFPRNILRRRGPAELAPGPATPDADSARPSASSPRREAVTHWNRVAHGAELLPAGG